MPAKHRHQQIFKLPVLGWFSKLAVAIPIASQRVDPAVCEQSFARAREVLADGDWLCLFPEGALTRDA